MKIGSFSGSSYRRLPWDYADTHESTWVDFDAGLLDPLQVNKDINDSLDVLEAADRAGFDLLGLNEHHSSAFTMNPSPNLLLAALARRTSKAALLALGNSIALYNPPQRVAEELGMVDVLSGGRVIAGFPVGTPMDTCFAYGTNPSELRARWLDAFELITQAWRRPESFAFNGRFHQQRYVNVVPRPVQKPHPPIWIPAGGSVETWRFCAEHDLFYSYLTHTGFQSGEKTVRGFWEEMKAHGREPNPFQVGVTQFVGLAETEEEAFKLYREPGTYLFNVLQHVHPRWSNPPGYVTENTIRTKLQADLAQGDKSVQLKTEVNTMHRKDFDQMVEQGFIMIGTPDQVAEKITRFATSQGVGNVMFLMQYGNMSKDVALYNTELAGKYLLPQLKGLFESEWEHKWWPKPLSEPARPAEVVLA